MKPIAKKEINVEVNNHCHFSCLYCTRYMRHLSNEQKFNITPEQFDEAMKALKGYPKKINFFGGEPTLHPQFDTLCSIARRYFPKRKLQLFTSGGKRFNQHYETIRKTFKNIHRNEHNENKDICRHQPLTIAVRDVVPDIKLRNYLIQNCWVDRTWCAGINRHGVYFCEIAGAIDDTFFGGVYAAHLKPKFWKDTNFELQRELCQYCGMCIPMEREPLSSAMEKFSKSILDLAMSRNMMLKDNWIDLFNYQFTLDEIRENAKTWYPGNFREDKIPDELCNEGLGIPNFEL